MTMHWLHVRTGIATSAPRTAAPAVPTHHDWATAGIALQGAGRGGLNFFEKAIMTSLNFDQEGLPFAFNKGVSSTQRDEIKKRAQSLVREVPGTTAQENLKSIAELWTLDQRHRRIFESG
jgi:hypothetical protein